jgi:hypothetical protein
VNLWTVGCADPRKLHTTPQQDGINLLSGNHQTSSRPPAFSLFFPEAVQTTGTIAGNCRTPGVFCGFVIRWGGYALSDADAGWLFDVDAATLRSQ